MKFEVIGRTLVQILQCEKKTYEQMIFYSYNTKTTFENLNCLKRFKQIFLAPLTNNSIISTFSLLCPTELCYPLSSAPTPAFQNDI